MNTLIKTGIIGDFNGEFPPHKATNEALKHCADYLDFEHIEAWYNRKRIHSSIGYITPQKCQDLAKKLQYIP